MNKSSINQYSENLIPYRERAIAILTAILLAFQGWSLGSFNLGPQLFNLSLGIAIFLLLFAPDRNSSIRPKDNLYALLRFPLFWIGLIFLIYILIQGLNPSYEYIENDYGSRWLLAKDNISWLPSSIQSPFTENNSWRVMMIWITAIFTSWGVIIGLNHKKLFINIAWALMINVLACAIVALIQKLNPNGLILGMIESPNQSYLGAFVYRNHGGVFFYLHLCLAFGMFIHYFIKDQKKDFYKMILALIVLISIIAVGAFSYSRGTVIIMLIQLGIMSMIFLYTVVKHRRRAFIVIIPMIIICAGAFAVLIYQNFDKEMFLTRYGVLKRQLNNPEKIKRYTVIKASYDMIREKPLLGWGAGSFEFAFRKFQEKHENINYYWRKHVKYQLNWGHAHSDLMELLVEYGIIGFLIILSAILLFIYKALIFSESFNPLLLCITLGLISSSFHSLIDFIIYCPALLITLSFLMCFIARYPELLQNAEQS